MSCIELHAASAFSFLQAASLPETLVDRAAVLGYPALALLDRDGVYGAPRFHRAAKTVGIRPIIGAELTIAQAPGSRPQAPGGVTTPGQEPKRAQESGARSPEPTWRLPVLVESPEGYRNLCRLVTRMKLRRRRARAR